MENFLLLGFLVGMGHALEADHLAAVGAMATDGGGRRRLALRGAAWGLGHTITLFAICSAVILFSVVLSSARAAALEFAVGVMLVLLAADLLFRMWCKKVHFHAHDHGRDNRHIHAHSHEGAVVSHRSDPHAHAHALRFPLRAMLVGLVHGAAGSAGMIALALATTRQPAVALGYVLVFGLGSLAGMAALSAMAAWPLGLMERAAGRVHSAAQLAIAGVAAGIGLSIMAGTWALAGLH